MCEEMLDVCGGSTRSAFYATESSAIEGGWLGRDSTRGLNLVSKETSQPACAPAAAAAAAVGGPARHGWCRRPKSAGPSRSAGAAAARDRRRPQPPGEPVQHADLSGDEQFLMHLARCLATSTLLQGNTRSRRRRLAGDDNGDATQGSTVSESTPYEAGSDAGSGGCSTQPEALVCAESSQCDEERRSLTSCSMSRPRSRPWPDPET